VLAFSLHNMYIASRAKRFIISRFSLSVGLIRQTFVPIKTSGESANTSASILIPSQYAKAAIKQPQRTFVMPVHSCIATTQNAVWQRCGSHG